MKIKTKRGARRIRNQRVIRHTVSPREIEAWDFVSGDEGELHLTSNKLIFLSTVKTFI